MDYYALTIYIAVQCFTPGPSNLMSMYTATSLGFRGARGFRLGSYTGLTVKLILCGLLNVVLATVVPELIPYLKWVGAAYLVYLAIHILLSGRRKGSEASVKDKSGPAATFIGGIMLQVLNMKSWIMALTLFSMYVIPYTMAFTQLMLATLICLALMVTATLLWTLAGHTLKSVYGKYRLPFDILFAGLLLYSAVMAVM